MTVLLKSKLQLKRGISWQKTQTQVLVIESLQELLVELPINFFNIRKNKTKQVFIFTNIIKL